MDEASLDKLEERLRVKFKDRSRLLQALTHRSAVAAENSLGSNERMEFLGDSVVGLVIGEYLYTHYPDYTEGSLAKAKSYIVSETSLADAAQALGLEEFVQLSAGEAASGGRRRRSILSDAFEALIAAVYLDCGIRTARRIVRTALQTTIAESASDKHRRDFKSALQEHTQASERQTPTYRIALEEGRDHDKTFFAEAIIGDRVIGSGSGKSKKEAEQAAACAALEQYLSLEADPLPDTLVPAECTPSAP